MVNRPVSAAEYDDAVRLRLALRRFLTHSERITRAAGLTPQRYQLLLLIKHGAAGATVGALADGLELSQSNVTQQVRRAEDLGLVRRRLSTTDARVRHLSLTPEGEKRLAKAVAELAEERALLAAAVASIDGEAAG